MKQIQQHILLATSLLIGTLSSCGTESTLPPGLAKIGATLNSAFDLQSKGDVDGAKAAYQKVLDEQPQDISTRLNLANLQLRTGETEKAISTFQSILQDDPENAIASSGLAAALEKSGQSDVAQQVRAKTANGLLVSETGNNNTPEKPDWFGKEIIINDVNNKNKSSILPFDKYKRLIDIKNDRLHVKVEKYSNENFEDSEKPTDISKSEYTIPYKNIAYIDDGGRTHFDHGEIKTYPLKDQNPIITNDGTMYDKLSSIAFYSNSVPSAPKVYEQNRGYKDYISNTTSNVLLDHIVEQCELRGISEEQCRITTWLGPVFHVKSKLISETIDPEKKTSYEKYDTRENSIVFLKHIPSFVTYSEIYGKNWLADSHPVDLVSIAKSPSEFKIDWEKAKNGVFVNNSYDSSSAGTISRLEHNFIVLNDFIPKVRNHFIDDLDMEVLQDEYIHVAGSALATYDDVFSEGIKNNNGEIHYEKNGIGYFLTRRKYGNSPATMSFEVSPSSVIDNSVSPVTGGDTKIPLTEIEQEQLISYISALPGNRLKKIKSASTCSAETGSVPPDYNPESLTYKGPNSEKVYSLLNNLTKLQIPYKLPADPDLCGDGGTPPDFFAKGLLGGSDTVKVGNVPVLKNCQRDFLVAAATLNAYSAAGYSRKIGTRSDGKTAEQLAADSADLMMKNLASADALRDASGKVPNSLFALGVTTNCWSEALYP